jgi:hypothetical protein
MVGAAFFYCVQADAETWRDFVIILSGGRALRRLSKVDGTNRQGGFALFPT